MNEIENLSEPRPFSLREKLSRAKTELSAVISCQFPLKETVIENSRQIYAAELIFCFKIYGSFLQEL